MKNEISKIRKLVEELNLYRDAYYNSNKSIVTNSVYDRMFDELSSLENKTGFKMSNSPTSGVGYKVISKLTKTKHHIPLLSLDKTKSSQDINGFMCKGESILMIKLDGLTVKLVYDKGKLVEASTRGDGVTGEVITHNAITFSNISLSIPFMDKLVIVGEAFIYNFDFEKYCKENLEEDENSGSSRNLASGSVRSLDSKICGERKISFIPFNVLGELIVEGKIIDSKISRLLFLDSLGFSLIEMMFFDNQTSITELEEYIELLKIRADTDGIPIDGLVVTYNDVEFSALQGRTGHHYKDGLAFKFADDLHETILREVEWNTSRFGEITPVAIFDRVSIDCCDVSRASLHNLNFISNLGLKIGDRIVISKRNMIIPHIEGNLDGGNETLIPPTECTAVELKLI